MKPTAIVSGWMLMAGMIFGLTGYSGEETAWAAEPVGETVQAAEPATRTWAGGGSIGFRPIHRMVPHSLSISTPTDL